MELDTNKNLSVAESYLAYSENRIYITSELVVNRNCYFIIEANNSAGPAILNVTISKSINSAEPNSCVFVL